MRPLYQRLRHTALWVCASARALDDVHAIETQVAALRPPAKGTAARLAALGPDGLPLTAGHAPLEGS